MATRYEFAVPEDINILKELLQDEDYQELGGYNIRFGLLYAITEDNKTGAILPTFKTLPYRVKCNGAKDRLLNSLDVEIQLDWEYWSQLNKTEEKKAVVDGALNQLEIVEKKDMASFNDDGTVKLRLTKPDINFEGYSAIAEKYGSDSPEIKKYRQMNSEFEGILI